MVRADIIVFCAILQLGIRDYCLLIEHVHFRGPTELAAVTLIWVTVQLMKTFGQLDCKCATNMLAHAASKVKISAWLYFD
jgi:hypothetical protein